MLSVVIPAYNEADRIGPTLSRMEEYLSGLGREYEIIVVDDGSSDRTREVVLEAARRAPSLRLIGGPPNRGKGHAVNAGFLDALGGLVLFSDADLSTPIEELGRFLEAAEAGADIVIGSRAARGADIVRRQPVYRVLMGKAFNKIVRALTVRGVKDTQCGFKLFRKESCGALFRMQRMHGFSFDVELLFLAQRRGLRVVELPVRWMNSPDSKVRVVRDSLLMLRDVVRIRWDYLTGKYAG